MSILNYLHFSTPTNEQVIVLRELEKFVSSEDPYDFFILCGAAGTGKTSITAALIGLLNEINVPYKISAPTGRAARILGRKAKSSTSTIHSLIYTPQSDKETGQVTLTLKIGYNSVPNIYIVDEASMISKDVGNDQNQFKIKRGLIYDLISFVKGANTSNKIIFLGDRYQLPPINESESFALNPTFLENTFNLKGHSFLLSEVKRQEDGSYILENATSIRKAIDRGDNNAPIEGKKSRNIYSAADQYVSDSKKEGFENQVAIGVSHKANKFFNDLVRERMFGHAKKILEKGDLLMAVQNWARNGEQLFNGDHVELLSIDWDLLEQVGGLHFVAIKIKVLFSEKETIIEDLALLESLVTPGGKIEMSKENELRNQRYIKNRIFRESGFPSDDRYVGALRLVYGHAITCNKAQGGEWKKVFINTLGIPSLKWQYTAVTRGIDEIEKF